MRKYSEIKETLGIDREKKPTNEHALITHFLQNSFGSDSEYMVAKAQEYISERLSENISKVSEPNFEYLLPLDWDIPFPPPAKPTFKFIDLFAGIGGFRLALQKFNGKCVFSSEIDNAAKKTYELNFGEYPFGDIKEFTNENILDKQLDEWIPDHQILAGGFPCQPFSLAGVSARNSLGLTHGFEDKEKGNLFFDIARIIEVKKPDVVFLENVKNFKSHDGGNTFETVKRILKKELKYDFHFDILNSQTLVPQRRNRFFIVAFKEKNSFFKFPKLEGTPKKLKSILEKNVSEEYTISNKLWEGHQRRTKRNLERGTGFTAFLADLEKPSNTLVARYGKDGKECLIPQLGKNPRKLTPRECARLQGFPENYKLPSSNAASYKQFGNSVAVPVIEKIVENIIRSLELAKMNENQMSRPNGI